MASFNHTFDIAFSVNSSREDASDVTPDMLRAALMRWVGILDRAQKQDPKADAWGEACGLCDTYENDDLDEIDTAREAAEARWHHHEAADTLDLY